MKISILHSYKKKRNHILTIILFIGSSFFIFISYKSNWEWTGFETSITTQGYSIKTLWDWMQLLIVPFLLAIGGLWFSNTQKQKDQKEDEQRSKEKSQAAEQRARIDRELTLDNQREILLQSYLDRMSELLLEKGLRSSEESDEVRYVARARTLTALARLDGERKRSVVTFLSDSQLLNIVNLENADLSNANLKAVNLCGATLHGANFNNACLEQTELVNAQLECANFTDCDLSLANLSSANLLGASLENTNLSHTEFGYSSLEDTNFTGASLKYTHLEGTNLISACFKDAHFTKVYLDYATLDKAILSEDQIKNLAKSDRKYNPSRMAERHAHS